MAALKERMLQLCDDYNQVPKLAASHLMTLVGEGNLQHVRCSPLNDQVPLHLLLYKTAALTRTALLVILNGESPAVTSRTSLKQNIIINTVFLAFSKYNLRFEFVKSLRVLELWFSEIGFRPCFL